MREHKKILVSVFISSLLLTGCGDTNTGAEIINQIIQQETKSHQINLKPKDVRGEDLPSKEYLEYMKVYNPNSLLFSIVKNKGWKFLSHDKYQDIHSYYIDIDYDNQTGYYNKWIPKVGADYLLEDRLLYKYTGVPGSDEWSWARVSSLGLKKIDMILAYGVTINEDWSFRSFLGYYDTKFPYKEKIIYLKRDEGEKNNHGSFYITEDDESFYIRGLNRDYTKRSDTKFYNYHFNINGIKYLVEGNTLFNQAGDIIGRDLIYTLHEANSVVVIPKNLLLAGEINLERVVIRDSKWNILNSYKYKEGEFQKPDRQELMRMIKDGENYSQVDTSMITDMSKLFDSTIVMYDITRWDVSNVTDMSDMFYTSGSFNQPIENWDVSNVTNMKYMFYGAKSFNQPIGNWDVSNVTNMRDMFLGARLFNLSIGNWDVSNVTDMTRMFYGAKSFNQSIRNWDVSNVENKWGMFLFADKMQEENKPKF